MKLLATLAAALMTTGVMAGQYSTTAHGKQSTGVQRLAGIPRGNCDQCHSAHGSDGQYYDFALFEGNFGAAKNQLCYTSGCHDSASPKGVYHGPTVYATSAHNTDPNAFWPGPSPDGRAPADSGNCANCHDPHGLGDNAGLIPALAVAREETLCLTCHDSNGPSMKDIARQLSKTYTHRIADGVMSGRHAPGEDIITTNYSGMKRHVECVDCHNPHKLPSSVTHTPGTNTASDVLKGVSRVEAQYGASAWMPPAFSPRAANYVTDTRFEYEVCFKCHSSWAYGSAPPTAPSGGLETDQSVEFNPNNLSYHPVVAEIKNNSYTSPTATNGNIETMESPWDNGRHDTMYCADCHRSEVDNETKGPHGSYNAYMLRAATGATDNTFCLKCHKASVYAPSTDPGSTETGSRFDRQTTGNEEANHYFHVIGQQARCRDCHAGAESGTGFVRPGSAHGSNRAYGFVNGAKIRTFTPGLCTPTCHDHEDYTAGPE